MKHNGGTIRTLQSGYMAHLYCAGRGVAHRCETLKAARAWIDANVGSFRSGADPLSSREVLEYREARAALPHGSTLLDAARALAAASAGVECPTVADAWAAFLADKTAAGLRQRSLQGLRHRVGGLARQYGPERLDALTVDRLSQYLAQAARTAVNRNNYRRHWSGFFRWALARGFLRHNPVAGITVAREEAPEVDIFTPDQAAALMAAAVKVSNGMAGYLALGLFAGIRTAELMRLRWEDVSQERIRIRSATAKMGEERYVAVLPPLGAWLARYGRKTGRVCPVDTSARDRRLVSIRKVAGLTDWPHNGMRHSYGSYLLALTGDSAKVAHQLGHHDPETTWRHYRHLVDKSQAEAYFAIVPG